MHSRSKERRREFREVETSSNRVIRGTETEGGVVYTGGHMREGTEDSVLSLLKSVVLGSAATHPLLDSTHN